MLGVCVRHVSLVGVPHVGIGTMLGVHVSHVCLKFSDSSHISTWGRHVAQVLCQH